MLVGEAPGKEEEKVGFPFVGGSGREAIRMLHESGYSFPNLSQGDLVNLDKLSRDDVKEIWQYSGLFITNVARQRPRDNKIDNFFANKTEAKKESLPYTMGRYPREEVQRGMEKLYEEINSVRPNVIVVMGNTALWALTGETGMTHWRGSFMTSVEIHGHTYLVVPAYHPAAILRQWSWRILFKHDISTRVLPYADGTPVPVPEYDFILRPGFEQALSVLNEILLRAEQEELKISSDIETRHSHIACVGLAWSTREAICIPFMTIEKPQGYWSLDEELVLVERIRQIHQHPNIRITGQNFNYDQFHFAWWWGFISNLSIDTMTAHHTLHPALPKALDFLSSLYCSYHRFWKEESEEWDPNLGEAQFWEYNCKDVCVTYEVSDVLEEAVKEKGKEEQNAWQHDIEDRVLLAELRGVNYSNVERKHVGQELSTKMNQVAQYLIDLVPQEFVDPKAKTPWYQSPTQLGKLFYKQLGIKPVLHPKTKRPTTDKSAIPQIGKKEPLVKPICDEIGFYRSLGVYYNTFVKAPTDADNRIRCTYDVNGTITFRFSSRANPIRTGTNLQNIPKGKGGESDERRLPKLRRLFKPDSGYMMFDIDLDRADIQIVAWDSGCEALKNLLKQGADVHSINAQKIWNDSSIGDGDPRRQLMKNGGHATNYMSSVRTVAATLGVSEKKADAFMKAYFEMYPEILDWHETIEHQLYQNRTIANPFGYEITYFDRIQNVLTDAVAWIPQSTVGLLINRIWANMEDNLQDWGVQVLMQVHDSLVGQFPVRYYPDILPYIEEQTRIVIPYEDPLTISTGIKVSRESWGDCKEVPWTAA